MSYDLKDVLGVHCEEDISSIQMDTAAILSKHGLNNPIKITPTVYLNELSLKKEIVLINNSAKMKKDDSVQEHNNIQRIDDIITEYSNTDYNIRKGELDEEFVHEVSKCFIKKYSKEEFGRMLLQMIRNIARRSCFSGYTNNWKDDFFIDAIEKVLKYMHNFNPMMISERTGKRVKAFAYVTQIINHAFVSVINKKHDEKEKSSRYETISYSIQSIDGVDGNYGFTDKMHNISNNNGFGYTSLKQVNKALDEEAYRTDIYKLYECYDMDGIIKILTSAEEAQEKFIRIIYDFKDENLKNRSLTIQEYDEITKVKYSGSKILQTKERFELACTRKENIVYSITEHESENAWEEWELPISEIIKEDDNG